MKFGVTLPWIEPALAVEFAQLAEAVGWDGFFYWDSIYMDSEGDMYDPWIILAAVAHGTTRIRLGPMLTPLARRRPWKVARETVTLDHLSRGRLILPVGLGTNDDGGFAKVGEATERKIKAQRLDEGIAILKGLWSGEPFAFQGAHYHLDEMTFLPRPFQTPRIPLWVVGAWPREPSMRRALGCDGVLPVKMEADGKFAGMEPEDFQAMQSYLREHRQAQTPFDIIVEGETPGDDAVAADAIIRPLAEAGVTWWLENIWDSPRDRAGIAGMRERIQQGPPGSLR